MLVESKKTYSHGFLLKEDELRRIAADVLEQLGKLDACPAVVPAFKMVFRNGATAETASLDDVIKQENTGSGLIVRLSAEFTVPTGADTTSVSVSFVNTEVEEEERKSVRYVIRGQSRDWVFVTATKLDERIQKIRRFAIAQLGTSRRGTGLLASAMPVFLFVPVMFFSLYRQTNSGEPTIAEQVRSAYQAGAVKTPVDAIILVEDLRNSQLRGQIAPLFWALGGSLFLMLLLVVGHQVLKRLSPSFNFCWGDYVEEFQRKTTIRNYIFATIIGGFLISFIASILANRV